MIILQNEIECLSCGDIIYSAHRHDFKYCKCGKVAVDGGMSYLRRVYDGGYKERSISIDEQEYKKFDDMLTWCAANKRNNKGTICAIFRLLRETGYYHG